jgi:hypothetical protein
MTANILPAELTDQTLEAADTEAFIEQCRVAGHEVHIGKADDYTVKHWRHSWHGIDDDSLRALAQQVQGAI